MSIIGGAAGRNYVAGFALLFGALMLFFFAAAVGRSLRSGEAGESSYSSVPPGGLFAAAAGFGLLGVVQIALTDSAKTHDAATAGEARADWFSAPFLGLGLGGLFAPPRPCRNGSPS